MKKKQKLILAGLMIFVLSLANIYLSTLLHLMLSTKSTSFPWPTFEVCIKSVASVKLHLMLFLCMEGFILLSVLFLLFNNIKPYQSDMMQITPEISTPVPAGQKQHGSARWMTAKEKDAFFQQFMMNPNALLIRTLIERGYEDIEQTYETKIKPVDEPQTCINRGGIMLGMIEEGSEKSQRIYYEGEDRHTLGIGSTGSGKTRNEILESIGIIGLSGESMILSDPKGELYQYSYPYLKRLGYEAYAVDFRSPLKSNQYNYLQTIINAIDHDDISDAIDATWDLTANLVGEAKGERIWNDGEASVIASSIMSVVYDNREERKKKYQNMTNAYFFIAEMCKTINNKMPIIEYVKKLPDHHPAKGLLAISEVAPSRTRGSFYTAALTTLRLFTNPSIYSMTSGNDFNPAEIGSKKQAVFIILPDEKTTYYPLASLLVSQIYEQLIKTADARGGRLERRVHFMLDEFGNFVKISDFSNKLTVSRSRGIVFDLFIQSFAMLENKYGREVAKVIRDNCDNWIYLKSNDSDTTEEISKRLGNYTVSSYSLSSNQGRYTSPTTGQSTSLMSRPLLTPDEIRMIKRPFSLVSSSNHPAIMYAPDLSVSYFNRMFGLGDEEYNVLVRKLREDHRPQRIAKMKDIELWGIWKQYALQCYGTAPTRTQADEEAPPPIRAPSDLF